MTRKFKRLGIAVVAVLAMSAVVASAAQAVPFFEADSYPATITASNTKGTEKFTTEAGAIECDASYHAELTEKSSTLTVKPTYTNCEAFGLFEATVDMMGCDYLFHATQKTAVDVYDAHVDLVCPPGSGPVTINAFTCKTSVPAQSGLTTAKLTDDTTASPKKDVTIKPEVTGINYTVTEDGFLCPFNGTGAKTGATYTSSEGTTATGESPSNPATKIGIQVAGE